MKTSVAIFIGGLFCIGLWFLYYLGFRAIIQWCGWQYFAGAIILFVIVMFAYGEINRLRWEKELQKRKFRVI